MFIRMVFPSRLRPSLHSVVLSTCGLIFFLNLSSVTAKAQPRPDAYQKQGKLYRIEVEDADEAGLIVQELKVRPELLRGKSLYYFGNGLINRRLAAFGYTPQSASPDEVFTRIVRIRQSGEETTVRTLGARIILRERETWVVRGTLTQLRLLSSRGYKLEALGNREPQPRRIQLVLHRREEVPRIGGDVEIDHVGKTNNGYL
ncbi:MAG: hypothetical protein ABJB61_06360, partial [bacterium]